MRLFSAIADDLTGGMELAALLIRQGVRCTFVTSPDLVDADDEDEAIVVAQQIRTVPFDQAVSAVKRCLLALQRRGANQYFYKYCATFDSNAQGNIGPCVDAMADALSAGQTLFVPSFPEAGRTVYQGHHFVGSQLLAESPKRHDPVTPMTDSNLVRVLQAQTSAGVGLLPLTLLRQGDKQTSDYLKQLAGLGVTRVIADAVMDEDLARLAALTANWPLMTGNSTIAGHYPALWEAMGRLSPTREIRRLPGIDGPAAVLAGSCAERTLEQLSAFEQVRPVFRVDLREAALSDILPELMNRVLAHIGDGPVAIATSAHPDDVAMAQAHLGVRGAADLAENILSRAAAALRQHGVRRFLVAGGETSGSVMSGLDVQRLLVGRYEAAGVARAISADGNLAICLKSGKLGPVDMFLSTLERMRIGEE